MINALYSMIRISRYKNDIETISCNPDCFFFFFFATRNFNRSVHNIAYCKTVLFVTYSSYYKIYRIYIIMNFTRVRLDFRVKKIIILL